jgi:hypothetical protein
VGQFNRALSNPHETNINRRHPGGRHRRCDNERKRPARRRSRNSPRRHQRNNPWREGWTRLLRFRSSQHPIKADGQCSSSNRCPEKARIRSIADAQGGAYREAGTRGQCGERSMKNLGCGPRCYRGADEAFELQHPSQGQAAPPGTDGQQPTYRFIVKLREVAHGGR